MKVAVCTLCINDWYQEIVKYCIHTLELYCKKHKYDFIIANEVYDGKRACPWYKIKAIQKILPNYDVVFWIDADGFILKPQLSVQYFIDTFLPPDKDIFIGAEYNFSVNTGIIILRNTPFVHCLLHEIWNNKDPYDASFHEQASMSQIYDSNKLMAKDKIVILPLDNKYPLYCYWAEYFPNQSFFVHIARCIHDKPGFVRMLDYYCPIRMKEDVEGEYEKRISWLLDEQRCRTDITRAVNKQGNIPTSTRSKLYSEKIST
jgi:hypothetical protein